MAKPKPVRIRRSRAKGARMVSPNGLPVVYVGRPTTWGNPFAINAPHPIHGWPMSRAEVVTFFRRWLIGAVTEAGTSKSKLDERRRRILDALPELREP